MSIRGVVWWRRYLSRRVSISTNFSSVQFPNFTPRSPTHSIHNSLFISLHFTMRLRTHDTPLTFTLKPRTRTIHLSATHITSPSSETQHDLSKRISTIASLPFSRLRVTFESSNRVLDKRIHKDSPPKVEDIPDEEGTVLIIKDLGLTFPFTGRDWECV